MTLKEVQIEVDQWINRVGIRYYNELTNTAILTEEVGEVARLMARIYGEQSFKRREDEENASENLYDEFKYTSKIRAFDRLLYTFTPLAPIVIGLNVVSMSPMI